jgi:WD40 repeat protein
LTEISTKKTRAIKFQLGSSVDAFRFSPDGRLLAGGERGTVQVADVVTGQSILALTKRNRIVDFRTAWRGGVVFSADSRLLAAPAPDGSVRVYQAATGREWRVLTGHVESVLALAFSPDGKRLVSGGMDRHVKVWDLSTGQELLSLRDYTEPVTSLKFSPDGSLLAAGYSDGDVQVWDGTRRR